MHLKLSSAKVGHFVQSSRTVECDHADVVLNFVILSFSGYLRVGCPQIFQRHYVTQTSLWDYKPPRIIPCRHLNQFTLVEIWYEHVGCNYFLISTIGSYINLCAHESKLTWTNIRSPNRSGHKSHHRLKRRQQSWCWWGFKCISTCRGNCPVTLGK